jgi:Ca2+:H+ antiporter
MGSIFSRMLLIPGACFFVGGLKYREQMVGGSTVSTMLFPTLASIMILLVPTALHSATARGLEAHRQSNSLSLGCAAVLLLLHAANLVFQLKTHADSFDGVDALEENLDSMEPELNFKAAALSLPFTLFLITVCVRNLVRSLPPIIDNSSLCRIFIGFVLLPFLGVAAEQITAMIVAYKNKTELALCVCIGGITQIVLFVTPVLFIVGAITDYPLTLYFGRWETVAVLCATVLLTALVLRGTSNYLDGLLCLGFYSIVVISFRILPEEIHPSD